MQPRGFMRFVLPTVSDVFGAVREQVTVQLRDVVFAIGNMFPSAEKQFHQVHVTRHLLLVTRDERFNVNFFEQRLYVSVC